MSGFCTPSWPEQAVLSWLPVLYDPSRHWYVAPFGGVVLKFTFDFGLLGGFSIETVTPFLFIIMTELPAELTTTLAFELMVASA